MFLPGFYQVMCRVSHVVHGVFLGRRSQKWSLFWILTRSSLVMHTWWQVVIHLSNIKIIDSNVVHGVFLGRRSQKWSLFWILTRSSLVMDMFFNLPKINTFSICLSWKGDTLSIYEHFVMVSSNNSTFSQFKSRSMKW